MKSRSLFVLALAAIMLLTVGVPTSLATVSPLGEFPIVDEPITLTYYREGAPTEQNLIELGENNVLKYIRDVTNINMEFVFVNSSEGKQKISLDFAADVYPDGALLDWATLFNQTDIMQYGAKEGILVPLNDMIDEYGNEIIKIFELRPNFKPVITAPDGNIYGLPRASECFHCMSYPKLWINIEWLEKLGLDEPQTTEELYEVLKAFKENDPNGNGLADEIALTGSVDYSCAAEYWLMNSFIDTAASSAPGNPRHFLSWINNQVTFVADKPEWKQGLEYCKMLFDEGLIDPANFSQNAEGLQLQARSDPDVNTVGAYVCDHMGMGVEWTPANAAAYHALLPVEGPNGVRFQSYVDQIAQIAGFQFAIFDKCANKEAMFRLADFFYSEDYLPIAHYGIEGVTWRRPDDPNALNIKGGPLKWVPIQQSADATEEELYERRINSFWMPIMGDLLERRDMWSPAATPETLLTNYETYLDYETQKTTKFWPEVTLPRSLFMESDRADEFSVLKLNISNHVLNNTSMFITGARSLDEWDAYVNELNQYGLEDYIRIYTEEYAKFIEKLQ